MEEVINSLIVVVVIVIVVLMVVGILKIRRNIRAKKGTETEKNGKEFEKKMRHFSPKRG